MGGGFCGGKEVLEKRGGEMTGFIFLSATGLKNQKPIHLKERAILGNKRRMVVYLITGKIVVYLIKSECQ
jgi:hypothetical protein